MKAKSVFQLVNYVVSIGGDQKIGRSIPEFFMSFTVYLEKYFLIFFF